MNAASPATLKLMKDAIVVDFTAPGSPMVDLTPDEKSTEDWIGSYERAGCTWVSFSVAMDLPIGHDLTIGTIAKARRWFLAHPERFVFAEKADDITRAKREGKMAVSFNFQGTLPFLRNLELVEFYKRLGVTHALMAYNNKNLVGDGCHERTDAGLSTFGLELIAEMNRVGMLVDVSHTGYRTALETIEASTAPVIMSHSLPRALFDHERNVPDDLIKAMAKTGGVMGMNGVGIFLTGHGNDISAPRIFEFLDYSVNLVGAKHVGFGLDYISNTVALTAMAKQMGSVFKKSGGYLRDSPLFASAAVISEIAEIMLQHKYIEADVRGILGENWMRVFREVCG